MEEFFKDKYRKELEQLAEHFPDQKSLNVDYDLLDKFNPELADDLLERPDVFVRAAEEAITAMDFRDPQGNTVKPNVRFYNIPQKLLIRNINSTHINKLLSVDSVLTKITDVRPKIKSGTFECVYCGRDYGVDQGDQLFGKLKEPNQCSCGKKDFKLDLDASEFIDMQKMEVQEPLEALVRGEQAKSIPVWMEDDLTNRLYPGDKVEATGVLRLIPPKHKGSVYNIYLHALHIQELQREFEDIEISDEEEKQILELSKDPDIYKKIVESISPTIYGYNEIKEALALQLFGGTKDKMFPDGTRVRPDIHVLLIGDPGTAKSQLLYYIYQLAPKGVFVGGKSATAAGLTATAEKDDFGEGGWTLKAGALVLASGGHAMVDEFDKMSDEDRSAMHEAMEQQRISIAKAGIVTTFKSETSILAAANPKFGRFDIYAPPAEQFDIPPTLLSRFDLIFPIKDVIDEQKDTELANHVLSAHQVASERRTGGVMTDEERTAAEDRITPVLEQNLLRKYIAYARRNINPVLTSEAMNKIQNYYVELRKMGKSQGTVPTTPRQLEALVRISEASARGRLSDKVEIEDAERALRLHQFVMREIGVDPATGVFDADWITGRPKSKMDKMRSVYNIVKKLGSENDVVSKDMIFEEAKATGVTLSEVDKILQDLKKEGDVYSPRHGEYRDARDR